MSVENDYARAVYARNERQHDITTRIIPLLEQAEQRLDAMASDHTIITRKDLASELVLVVRLLKQLAL